MGIDMKDGAAKEFVTAIVLAAGQGQRMKSSIQKQFMLLNGKPLLYYSLQCFQTCACVNQIILVTGEKDIEYCQKEVIQPYSITKVSRVVAGGRERYESVEHGLEAIDDTYAQGIVMIHDGARPFVTHNMIEASVKTAQEYGACTVGMPVKDTIKEVDSAGNGIRTPDRKTLWQIQTPQTFQVSLIRKAHESMKMEQAGNITDDTMLIEQFCGRYVKVIEGSYRNIKITTPEDMVLAQAFLDADDR